MVDSAAQVSVINTPLLEQLGSSVKLRNVINLRGADRDYELPALHTEDINITVGKLKTKRKFVATNISDKEILRIDFLSHIKALID